MSSMARMRWKIDVEKAVILAPGSVKVPYRFLDSRSDVWEVLLLCDSESTDVLRLT